MTDEPQSMDDVFSDEEVDALRQTPPELFVANHLFHLLELAAVHLSAEPPNLVQASLVIDAVAAVVDKLGERLGEPAGVLAEGLAQLQLAYVRLSVVVANG